MKKLVVHPQKQYLMYSDGEPFFYLADTAWELFHRLNRHEANYYLSTRAQQGFNVIQATVLAEFDGLREPNTYGRVPLLCKNGIFDPEKPDIDDGYDYWKHVDYIVKKAAEYGLYIAMLPTWGDKFNIKNGKGPEIFDEKNAYNYCVWLAERYKNSPNIIWMLGGDRSVENDKHRAIIDAMGNALRKTDPDHLITYHPRGESSSVDSVGSRDYIDFHTIQSSHALGGYKCKNLLRKTAQEKKPFMDAEPRYEDHPACFNSDYGYFWDEDDVRQNAYWALMEGVCGHTYGNHCIWIMNREVTPYFPFYWQDVLHRKGASQMKHVRALRLSRPYFEFVSAPELILDDNAPNAHQCAGRGDKYAFAYSPLGQPIRVFLDKLCQKPVKVSWFDPRTGDERVFGVVAPTENLFVPPTSGKGNDWVLIMDVLD